MITATHINYYFICRRKLWLFANGITMEHTSVAVAEGKLIGDKSYPQRAEKYTEVEINGSKIDFYDARNKVIHEVKKSDSMEDAHEWQVKFYIWQMELNNVKGVSGILEYPKMRETKVINLEEADRVELKRLLHQIPEIASSEVCPGCINSSICKKCSYFEFCYVSE